MNLMEGRIGKREGAGMVLIACIISGLFAVDTERAFENGNDLYVCTLLAALISYLLFLLLCAAMKKCGAANLADLYRRSVGKWLGGVFGVMTGCCLVIAAVLPLIRMLLIMRRYVYMDASEWSIALYFVPCIAFLMLKGLETLGRTAKLFTILTVSSIGLAVAIAAPVYESYRLYPLFGGGIKSFLFGALLAIPRFLPALIALLICGNGVQGVNAAAEEGGVAVLFSGGFLFAVQLCLGLTYPSKDLVKMHSPMYRATMSVRAGGQYLRTDKALLFFWTIGAMIASAFYGYAAALLYCRTFSVRDIRPVALTFAAVIVSGMLMGQGNLPSFERAVDFITDYLFVFMTVPVLCSAFIALIKREKEGMCV